MRVAWLILIAAIVCCGCRSVKSQVEGFWKAKYGSIKGGAFEEYLKTPEGQKYEERLSEIGIEFRPDGSFIYVSPWGQSRGKWDVDGSNVNLTYPYDPNSPKPSFTLSKDGLSLHMVFPLPEATLEMDMVKQRT